MSVEGFAEQSQEPSAEILRRGIFSAQLARSGSSIGSIVGGLVHTGDLACSLVASELKAEVGTGECYVPSFTNAASGYYLRNTATVTKTLTAANASNPRIDVLVAQVKDATYHGASNEYAIEYYAGTAKAGATLANKEGAPGQAGGPALEAGTYVLAYIRVEKLATKGSECTIENVSTVALPGLQRYEEGTAGSRPAAGVKGRIYYATDSECLFEDTGTAWRSLVSVGASNKYVAIKEPSKEEAEAGLEASATRAAHVVLRRASGEVSELTVGGVVFHVKSASETTGKETSFILSPGEKWKAAAGEGLGYRWTFKLL